MILKLYKKLEGKAINEFEDIIIESGIIFSYSGRARKLRLTLIDNTFIDVWFSMQGEYSFHWEQREIRDSIYRHDNAPHKKWEHIKSFPKHCHNGFQENVIASHLSDKPELAIREFLHLVRKRIFELISTN